MEEGYLALANAIVEQAAKDYRDTMKALKCRPGSKPAKKRLKKIEEFFTSEWCGKLTDVNGEYLINRLRRETENDG